jgi:signal peptidase II
MKKIILIFVIFLVDRFVKLYLINLQTNGTDVDFYIFSFLNIFLVWNTGIGFGLLSFETNIFYHFLTFVIILINIGLAYLLYKSRGLYSYLIAIIIGGSLGNLFDRMYYYAVPDFIDFHLGEYHWFVFNVADIFISVGIVMLIIQELLIKKKL